MNSVIFFGTSEFAVPVLEKLFQASFPIDAVVTLPNRPQKRGMLSLPSPVKVIAAKHGCLILEPEKLSDPDFLKLLSEKKFTVGVVSAYGKIIPEHILKIPEKGFLNIHPSLLPELRGPSPIQYAILEGKEKTGATIMLLDKVMDHGPILLQEEFPILPEDTSESLGKKLSEKGADILVRALDSWLSGALKGVEQNHSRATFSKIINKEDGHIKWNEDAVLIERKIRAYHPWPGSFSFWQYEGKKIRLKIIKARVAADIKDENPGLVMKERNDMLIVAGNGNIVVEKIQPEGKRVISGEDFLNGYQPIINTILK